MNSRLMASVLAVVVAGASTIVVAQGRGGGGGGGGGRGGFGGGGIGPGIYRVAVTAGGKEIGAQTFAILEDTWLNEK